MNDNFNEIDFCWVIDIENHSQYTRTDDKELEYYDFDIDEATNIADNAIDNFENSITNNVMHHKEEICKELNISDFDIGEGDYDYDDYDNHLIKKIDFCIWIPKDAEVSIEKIKSVLSKYMDKTFSYSDNVSYDIGDYDEMNVNIDLFISSYLTDAEFLNEDVKGVNMILNENLFEDVIPTEEGKEWEKYYGKFVVKFPVDDNARTSQIEEMIRTNISKYTNGEVEDIDVFYASEVDEDKFLGEDWKDGTYTEKDIEAMIDKKQSDFDYIMYGIRKSIEKYPEYWEKFVDLLTHMRNSCKNTLDNLKIEHDVYESLKESVEDFSNGSPLAGENSGVASMLNALIKSEWDAIDDYNGAIATLSLTDEDYAEMINVLTDIAKEEHTHVGQLTEIMKLVSPNVEEQDKGREEAAGQLEEPVPVEKEEITEAKKAPASDPLKIERAEMSCLSALRNGATATEQIIQEVKWIYGITYDEAKEAFKKAHNKYMSEETQDLDEDFNYRYFARFVNNDTGEVMEKEGKNKKSLLYSILDSILYDSTPENLKNVRLTIEDTHTGKEEYYNPLDYIKNYEITGMNDLNNIIDTFEQNEYKSRDCRGNIDEYDKVDGKYVIYGDISVKGDLSREEIKKKISNLANVDKEKVFVENIVYDDEIEETLADFIINTDINYSTNFEKIANEVDEDEMNEDYVFYKPDKEGHLNFNPLVLGSSLELGDEVYDSKTGHKLKVDSEPIDFKYSRRITFLDLDTNEHKTQDVGIQSLWTKVVEGDTAEEVDDDLDIEWHPIDQYFKGELDEDKQF